MRIVNPTGVLGEDIAVDYLKNKGYKIIERNFRKKYEEIDIIAIQSLPREDPTLVFIEVKTRDLVLMDHPSKEFRLLK